MKSKEPNPSELHRIKKELAEMAKFPEMNPGPVCRMDRNGIVLLADPLFESLHSEERFKQMMQGVKQMVGAMRRRVEQMDKK